MWLFTLQNHSILNLAFWDFLLFLVWCFPSEISKIALPRVFSAPWFNATIPRGILGNRNVCDQATPLSPLVLIQESFMPWCNKIQMWVLAYCQRKTTQVQSSLSRCQKIQSNNTIRRCWQFVNQKWMILPIWSKTCCSPMISRLSPITLKGSNVVLSIGISPPLPLAANDYSWIPNLQWGFVLCPEF